MYMPYREAAEIAAHNTAAVVSLHQTSSSPRQQPQPRPEPVSLEALQRIRNSKQVASSAVVKPPVTSVRSDTGGSIDQQREHREPNPMTSSFGAQQTGPVENAADTEVSEPTLQYS